MLVQRREPVKIVAFDKLTYAGNLANLKDLLGPAKAGSSSCAATSVTTDGVEPVWSSTRSRTSFISRPRATSIAASWAPGRSFRPTSSARRCCLMWPRPKAVERFLQVGTDEVYGTLPEDQARD